MVEDDKLHLRGSSRSKDRDLLIRELSNLSESGIQDEVWIHEQLIDRTNNRLKWLASHLMVGTADWTAAERVGIELLESGHASTGVAELASVSRNSTDLLDLVTKTLEDAGDSAPTEAEAWEMIALETAFDVVLGRTSPYRGAARLWQVADRVPELAAALRPFVGMASEWEDDPDHRREYETDIVDACRSYVRKYFA